MKKDPRSGSFYVAAVGGEPVLEELVDGRHDVLDEALGGVDAQVVGALVSPLAVAVHLMVLGAVAVDLLHAALDLLGRQVLARRGAALAALHLGILVRVDENIQRVIVLEYHVSGAAHDDTVALLGEVLDDLSLGHRHADGLLHDLIGLHAEAMADGQRIGCLDALFRHVGHVVLVESVLLGDHLDDLVVVARDAQRLGQTLAQLTAAGTELTADGNDPAHNGIPPLFVQYS